MVEVVKGESHHDDHEMHTDLLVVAVAWSHPGAERLGDSIDRQVDYFAA
jgi:hypothetical protein